MLRLFSVVPPGDCVNSLGPDKVLYALYLGEAKSTALD